MEIKSIFQIQKINHSILQWEKKKKNFLKKIQDLKYQEAHFMSTKNITQSINLTELFTTVFKKELTLLEKTIKTKFKIQEVWVVHYKQFQEHIVHNHGDRGLFGIIHLNHLPEHVPARFLMPLNDMTTGRSIIYKDTAKEGDMVLMPAPIYHYTPFNKLKEVRSIIGFNLQLLE